MATCRNCGDEHKPPMCREWLVEVETTGYSPKLGHHAEVLADTKKQAREIIMSWRPEDWSYEGWTTHMGAWSRQLRLVSLDKIDGGRLPYPETWKIVSIDELV